MNIQRSNETHSLCVCVFIFFIFRLGFSYFWNGTFNPLHFSRTFQEMNWAWCSWSTETIWQWIELCSPMLIADVHSVYGSGIAASSLHLCSLFLNWSFGLLCMHRNEFELNRSYFFYSSAIRRHWAHARASPSSLHCCCISDIASGLCAVCVLCAIFFACLCVDVRFLIRESPDCFHARDEVISLFGGIRQHQQQQQQQPILLHLSRSPSRFHIFFA